MTEDDHPVLCCDGYYIDGVHDAGCKTTNGVYRCENCDFPFQRTTTERKYCYFCEME